MVAIATEVIGRSAGQDINNGNRTIERPWFARGATTEAEAIAAVAAEAPSVVDGLLLTSVSADEVVKDGYRCTANYGMIKPLPPPEVGQSSFHFEVSTQSVRIVVPLAPQTVYNRDGVAAPEDSDKWLIGAQGDGSAPEGCEVYEPAASFSESHILPATAIDATYTNAIMRTVGKLNNATFRGWDPGEVLCTGISGSKRGADDWEVTFRFSVKEHQTGLTVAGIEGINRNGWQFLWPRYSLQMDGNEKMLSNVVDHIVVADVFRSADFSALNIGS